MSDPVAVFTHPDCVRHDPGPGEPESPERLRVLLKRLESELGADVRIPAPATAEPLLLVHPREYLEELKRVSEAGGARLNLDVYANEASWDAVLGGTGAVVAALDHAHEGRGHAFVAIRPPGHHALVETPMGFCLVNNVVVAARWAQRMEPEWNRVLIIDWDVHHGNGTQALVETDPSIRYISLHQWPWYPGTGRDSERGVGNVFNLPRPPGLPAARYVADLWDAVERATTGWEPDVCLLSAGFDAMKGDPLGGFTLEPGDYAEWTRRLRDRLPEAPVVSLLEGGYNPPRVAEGVAAHIAALC